MMMMMMMMKISAAAQAINGRQVLQLQALHTKRLMK
jgi:hypothetical protein